MKKTSDPRKLGGSDIAGPGGPHDENAVVLETTNAILLDNLDVAVVGSKNQPDPMLAMLFGGRINKSKDRAQVMLLFDTDGAAAIISELLAMGSRMGSQFRDDLMGRVEKLLDEGNV